MAELKPLCPVHLGKLLLDKPSWDLAEMTNLRHPFSSPSSTLYSLTTCLLLTCWPAKCDLWPEHIHFVSDAHCHVKAQQPHAL